VPSPGSFHAPDAPSPACTRETCAALGAYYEAVGFRPVPRRIGVEHPVLWYWGAWRLRSIEPLKAA
jgi:hypothetical protein